MSWTGNGCDGTFGGATNHQCVLKPVQIEYDMNYYDSQNSQTCLILFRINMIRIDTIHKHVKTRNENMMKYTKIE